MARYLPTVSAADRALEDAWLTGEDTAPALAAARQANVDAGREPEIQDAKLIVASAMTCRPCEAYLILLAHSRLERCSVAALAQRVVATQSAPPPAPSTLTLGRDTAPVIDPAELFERALRARGASHAARMRRG